MTLKDIQTARADQRRSLRGQINERVARVVDFLPEHARRTPAAPSKAAPEIKRRPRSSLRTYREDP